MEAYAYAADVPEVPEDGHEYNRLAFGAGGEPAEWHAIGGKPMRIFFIGTVEFSRQALAKLLELNAEVVGVATKPNSNFHADYADVSDLCRSGAIPLRHISDINDSETIGWIKATRPDIIFCLGWSQLLREPLLKLAPLGVLGFHPAALPANRGRHPLIWALALGLQQTASSFFFMDEGADSGNILSQELVEIGPEDDAATLYAKVSATALRQMEKFLPELQSGSAVTHAQDHTKANYWRKRGRTDGQIDFRMSSSGIFYLVRALAKPYVGAHICYRDREVKVWKARISDVVAGNNLEPGKVLGHCGASFIVKSGDGVVEILEHEFRELPMPGEYL